MAKHVCNELNELEKTHQITLVTNLVKSGQNYETP